MRKYKDIKDFIKQEFMSNLDPLLFTLTEDDNNYYIEYEGEKLFTLYKKETAMAMREMNSDDMLDLGTEVEIGPDTGEVIYKGN